MNKKNMGMKKVFKVAIAFAALLFATLNSLKAQAYKQGDNLLNVGIGINSYYSGGTPIGASLEFGVTDKISVGPNIDYLSSNYGDGFKFTALYFGGRASYHFSELLGILGNNIDVYGGADIGYRSFSWSDNYTNSGLGGSYGSSVYVGLHAGIKYYFTSNIGAFAEGGAIGATNFRLGLGLKF